jgi:hypothetical protein
MLRAESLFSASVRPYENTHSCCVSQRASSRAHVYHACLPVVGRTSAARNKSSRPRVGQCCDYDNNRIKSSTAVPFETFDDHGRIWGIDCPRCHREAVRSAPAGLHGPDATWCRKPMTALVDRGTLQPRRIRWDNWDEPESLGENPGSHFGRRPLEGPHPRVSDRASCQCPVRPNDRQAVISQRMPDFDNHANHLRWWAHKDSNLGPAD